MMPRLPRRSALLIPVVIFGLLTAGLGVSLTRADTLPMPCGLANLPAPPMDADADLLMLSALTLPDVDLQQTDESPRTTQDGRAPGRIKAPSIPTPTGAPSVTQPSGSNQGALTAPSGSSTPNTAAAGLQPPDPAVLNLGPVQAARQLRESLTDQQKSDLQAVLTRNRDRFQQVRSRLPDPTTDPRTRRPTDADTDARMTQATAEIQAIGTQVDEEIEAVLTPQQRSLYRNAKPTRHKSELPAPPVDALPLAILRSC